MATEHAAPGLYPENKALRLDEERRAKQAGRFLRSDAERKRMEREGMIRQVEKLSIERDLSTGTDEPEV